MSQRSHDAKAGRSFLSASRPYRKGHRRCATREATKIPNDAQYQFDVDAWLAVIDEQRLRIARAAGVDPSKVRIRVGH